MYRLVETGSLDTTFAFEEVDNLEQILNIQNKEHYSIHTMGQFTDSKR